ncbi:DUF5071 domain-containing protein [Vibrio sinaloensis]|uniref:DUF5071 domain-containing protein n=1 Tax=Photobacterium sp. (strain ATCC 43367) TaxID=379097 RepID=UPI0035EC25E0
MIPKDKYDLDAIAMLVMASDDYILENSFDLLGWLQDCNWPVFKGVINRLSPLGDLLQEDIDSILDGDDCILKANIVGHLIPSFENNHQKLYEKRLRELLKNPSDEELQEGLIDYIEILLVRIEKNT